MSDTKPFASIDVSLYRTVRLLGAFQAIDANDLFALKSTQIFPEVHYSLTIRLRVSIKEAQDQ
jgi:hypothetical protein